MPSPDLPSGLNLKSSATKFLHAFITSPMHAVCPALHVLLCLITTTRSVSLIASLNTAAVKGYPADTGLEYEIAAVFGDTISGTHLGEVRDTVSC